MNKFSNKFAHPISNKVLSPTKEVSHQKPQYDNLKVSMVREDEDSPAKYVEIAMAQSDNDDDEDENGEAEFYQPIGLSPVKTKNELNGASAVTSDTKNFS